MENGQYANVYNNYAVFEIDYFRETLVQFGYK